jgi:hypothetical protein
VDLVWGFFVGGNWYYVFLLLMAQVGRSRWYASDCSTTESAEPTRDPQTVGHT